jgi:hypothetical protein
MQVARRAQQSSGDAARSISQQSLVKDVDPDLSCLAILVYHRHCGLEDVGNRLDKKPCLFLDGKGRTNMNGTEVGQRMTVQYMSYGGDRRWA